MTGRARALVLALLVWGIGLVVAGSFFDGYLQGVLLEVGAALLLAAPLVFAERLIEQRVEVVAERRADEIVEQATAPLRQEIADVRQTAETAVARLDQLGDQTRSELQSMRDADELAIQQAFDTPSFETLNSLLSRAAELKAVPVAGPRVAIPDSWHRLRFSTVVNVGVDGGGGQAWVAIEKFDGDEVLALMWYAKIPITTMFRDVAVELQKRSIYPGDESFDASAIIGRLIETLAFGIRVRNGSRFMRELGVLVEVVNDHWALTEEGLDCLLHHYPLTVSQVLHGEDMRQHVLEKSWVDPDKFNEAFDLARAWHGRLRSSDRQ